MLNFRDRGTVISSCQLPLGWCGAKANDMQAVLCRLNTKKGFSTDRLNDWLTDIYFTSTHKNNFSPYQSYWARARYAKFLVEARQWFKCMQTKVNNATITFFISQWFWFMSLLQSPQRLTITQDQESLATRILHFVDNIKKLCFVCSDPKWSHFSTVMLAPIW